MARVICLLCLMLAAVRLSLGQQGCPPLDPQQNGVCSEACKADQDCGVGQKCCSNGCGHECKAITTCAPVNCPSFCRVKKDKNGCETCDCNDPCPVVDCLPSCPNIRRAENGCEECYCDYPCPKIACLPSCQTSKDEHGCVVCDCPVACPDVACPPECGTVQGADGCDVCSCPVEPPLPPTDERCTAKLLLTSCSYRNRYRYVYDVDAGRCRRLRGRTCSSGVNKFMTMYECQEACQGDMPPVIIEPPVPVPVRPDVWGNMGNMGNMGHMGHFGGRASRRGRGGRGW